MAKKVRTQEQLFNRILINIGIAIVSYIFLYVLYARFYMMPSLMFAIIFFALSILGFVLAKLKVNDVKHYAQMFLAYGIALLFTNLSKIATLILGFDNFVKLMNTSNFFKVLMNNRYEVMFISYLGAIYLVGMLIYNIVRINKLSK